METFIRLVLAGLLLGALLRAGTILFRMLSVKWFEKKWGTIKKKVYIKDVRLFMVKTEKEHHFTCRGQPGDDAYGFLLLGVGRVGILEKIAIRELVVYHGNEWEIIESRKPFQFPDNVVDFKKHKQPSA